MSLLAMKGLVAVVTGAGSGIGLATLEAMLAEGARIAALDLRPPPAREGVLPLSCDVTDQASVDKAVAAAAQHFGGIDVLVNNAGIGAQGNVEENALDEWQRVFDVNVFGMVRLARACLPHLRKSQSPAIVNVASIVSWTGLPKRACYGASKGAVYALTLAMAADHAGEGIRVNCVCPGTVDTPWVGRLLVGGARSDRRARRAGRAPADRPARHRGGDRGRDHLSRLARGGLHDRQRAADRRRNPRHRGAAGSSALVKIRGLRALDVRCPTSRFLDGSDAVHGDPDYSAAYVILEADVGERPRHDLHDRPRHRGGVRRGARARAPGRRPRARGDHRRLRRLPPTPHQRVAAALARPRQGRDPSRDRRDRERGLGSVGQAGRQAGVEARRRSHAARVRGADRLALSDRRAQRRPGARPAARAASRARRRARPSCAATAIPRTSRRRAGSAIPRTRCAACAARRSPPAGRSFKTKVGVDVASDVRRCEVMREEIGFERQLMADANQVWDVPQAIEWMRHLEPFRLRWIEEPTSPDDVLGHAAIRRAVAPVGVATGEHCANKVLFKQLLQAEAIDYCQVDACRLGGLNEVLAVLLLAAHFGVPVCPHAGGLGLCEYVQHISLDRLHRRERVAARPHDRVRRPPARALRGSGARARRALPACPTRPATRSRCAPSRSPRSASPTARSGGVPEPAERVQLGATAVRVTRLGLGCAPLGNLYEADERCAGAGHRRRGLGRRHALVRHRAALRPRPVRAPARRSAAAARAQLVRAGVEGRTIAATWRRSRRRSSRMCRR